MKDLLGFSILGIILAVFINAAFKFGLIETPVTTRKRKENTLLKSIEKQAGRIKQTAAEFTRHRKLMRSDNIILLCFVLSLVTLVLITGRVILAIVNFINP